MTHAHETFRDHVEQEAADEFVGIQDDGLFSISIFAIPIAQGDLAVVDLNRDKGSRPLLAY